MASVVELLKTVLRDPAAFAEGASRVKLRSYQEAAARAVVQSVLGGEGRSIVVMFPRQSGKNELQAQIEAYLLTLLSETDAEIVKVSPTWKPQSQNAMRRLERVLSRNVITRGLWVKEQGTIFRVNRARVVFLSGAPEAHIMGATAATLLEVDEAQDVQIAKFDRDIAPMAASTNATRVFWGTAWTRQTLLARELRAAREAEARDGLRRVFTLSAEAVAREVPAYGAFVEGQVARLGRSHPMVRSQYFSEEIEAQGGLFGPERRALMQGNQPRRREPEAGKQYALLLDVAGEDEGAAARGVAQGGELRHPERDATALTVVEVDLSGLGDALLKAPVYRVTNRWTWQGERHPALYGQISAIAAQWGARRLVVDATGVGAGLASFLERALPGRVRPFVFNAATKSKLGWDFLAVIETGRFKDWQGAESDTEGAEFWQQAAACQSEILPGPERRMRWGVPDGTRDPQTGSLIHDDLLISAALCAVLDECPWRGGLGGAVIIPGRDPMDSMQEF